MVALAREVNDRIAATEHCWKKPTGNYHNQAMSDKMVLTDCGCQLGPGFYSGGLDVFTYA